MYIMKYKSNNLFVSLPTGEVRIAKSQKKCGIPENISESVFPCLRALVTLELQVIIMVVCLVRQGCLRMWQHNVNVSVLSHNVSTLGHNIATTYVSMWSYCYTVS